MFKNDSFFKIIALTAITCSSLFGNISIKEQGNISFGTTVYAEENTLKNYEDNPYTDNYMSGRLESSSGYFFNQTNKELEQQHKRMFGKETREEEQKRVEETGISSQPVLGQYRPDDHIADAISSDEEAKKENLVQKPIDVSEEETARAVEECVKAGYSKDHCAKIAPRYAECLKTEADPLFCAMYLRVQTEDTEKTNGTDGMRGVIGKYGALATEFLANPSLSAVGNFIKEGASDLVDWAKENPFEAAFTVATLFFPFGLVGNLAVRGILMGAGAISKGAKFARLVRVMEGSGNIVGRVGNKVSAWATETIGGKTVTQVATKINDVSNAVVRKYHQMGDFIRGGRKITDPITGKSVESARSSLQYKVRDMSTEERWGALKDYLKQKRENGIPLSYQDRLLDQARKAALDAKGAGRFGEAEKIGKAATDAFKVSQESAASAPWLRNGSRITAVGIDAYNFDSNSNHPIYGETEVQRKYKQTKENTETDRKAISSMYQTENERSQYYRQEARRMEDSALEKAGVSRYDTEDTGWKTLEEAQQQAQEKEAKRNKVLSDLAQTEEYQEAASKVSEAQEQMSRLKGLANNYDSGARTYHPTEGDSTRMNLNVGKDAAQEAQKAGLL